jgi:hypothetical protein
MNLPKSLTLVAGPPHLHKHATFGVAVGSLSVAEDISYWIKVSLEDDNHVLRLTAADCLLSEPNTGSDVRFDIMWSPPLTDSGGGAIDPDWQSVLAAAIPPGDSADDWWILVHDGYRQCKYPVKNFATFPVDLPNGSILRLDCLTEGITPSNERAEVYLMGDEVRIS